ncbi:cytochrome d ubiquinol oxidase subunit II [Brevibacillus sp. FSL K6-0770]|uniref:Cytochrome D ubiquinol oxidase subunit II n=1 Tax=Brevibacillus parabrevis TaxID=54914 RepID=A0A4Y3PDJ9_BREPA|nr:cytochrome d ubiquinol oxidase subunit II [Brevibacillus parabrevis]RNB93519.1 cytochrome d ubiquinol oxidase subunit II [Brevibacillus parabrevis]GEB31457.1 cytochrome D ubiquinol oxidase subunit II [Brevibacillus parabrevis]
MTTEGLGISILWLFLYGYIIVASIDFGAGFFSYYGRITGKGEIINKVISRYLSPVWEVTNVFLVFFFVGIVGFFPETGYYYGTALLVPASIALVLLTIRGSFYAFSKYGNPNSHLYHFLYAATGVLIPASFSTVLTISEGGFIAVEDGVPRFLAGNLFYSPYSWAVVFLALVSVLFISTSFLTYYANRADDPQAESVLRQWALFNSLPTIFASLLVFMALWKHNPEHFASLMGNSIWFILSFAFFLNALRLLIVKRSYGWMFISVMLQFFTAFWGYGKAHLPYLLYPYVSFHTSVTNPTMAKFLVAAFIGGMVLLIPSLFLLMRLFIFNAKYVKGKLS